MLTLLWLLNRLTPATLLTTNPSAKALVFSALLLGGMACVAGVFRWVRRYLPLHLLVPAALVIGAVLLLFITTGLRESSYVYFWPWLGGAVVYSAALRRNVLERAWIAWLGAVPALLLLPFVFYLLFQAQSLDTPLVVFAGVILGGAVFTLLPLLEQLAVPGIRWTGWAIAAVALAVGTAGSVRRGPNGPCIPVRTRLCMPSMQTQVGPRGFRMTIRHGRGSTPGLRGN